MDESGDLGFDFSKTKTSHYFVMSCLLTTNKRSLEKIVKNVFATMPVKQRKKHGGVLHCYKEHSKTRHKLFHKLGHQDNTFIISTCIDKKAFIQRQKITKSSLYNLLATRLLQTVLEQDLISKDQKCEFIAAKRETNKFLNKSFIDQMSAQHHKIKMTLAMPHQHKSLQIADAVNWAIFRKYEYEDISYYKMFEELIVEEIIGLK